MYGYEKVVQGYCGVAPTGSIPIGCFPSLIYSAIFYVNLDSFEMQPVDPSIEVGE